MKRLGTILLIIFSVTASSYAQTTSPDPSVRVGEPAAQDLQKYLDNLAAEDNFSGVVMVAKDGVPIFEKAFGMANKSSNTANTTKTKFNLASMNKMFTGVAIGQLAQAGKLSFQDTIAKQLPDYPNQTVAAKVTIHQLLTHTSGLGNYLSEKFFAQSDQVRTVRDILPFFVNDPLLFEPGSKWQYSNAGFVVLGLIIEKVSGQNYYDYVREHIFKPAGMKNTDSYEKATLAKDVAVGYTRVGADGRPDMTAPRKENTATLPYKGSPAGGGYSTVGDLLKFAIALKNYKLLNKEMTAMVTTGKADVGGPLGKYAYGFGDTVFNGRHAIWHNGGARGIADDFEMFPEQGYLTVVLSNYDPPTIMPVVMKLRELVPVASAGRAFKPAAFKPGEFIGKTCGRAIDKIDSAVWS